MNAINAARLLFAALIALIFGDRQRVAYEWRHTRQVAQIMWAVGLSVVFGGILWLLFGPSVWEALDYTFTIITN